GVDQLVLLDPREAVEGRVVDDHLEVVAAAGPVDHLHLLGPRKRVLEELLDPLPHSFMVARKSRSPGSTPAAAPAASSTTTFAPLRPAVRHGGRLRSTPSTTRSRSQKRTSSGKRMNAVWID